MSQNSKGIPAITGEIDYSRAVRIFPEALQPYRPTVIAYGASFLSTTIGFPLDTVKTRMQTHRLFSSYWDCVAKTYRIEGTRGFFRGIWAPLISTSFSKSFLVSIFTAAKPYCYDALFLKDEDPSTVAHPFYRNIPVCFGAGILAGGGVTLFACPFEFTKIYAQIAKLVHNKSMKEHPRPAGDLQISTASTVKTIVRHQGVRGLYSGFQYHFLRDSLSSGIYYSIYESLKWTMNSLINRDPKKTSQVSILLAGGLAGVVCWTCIFPIDTVKSLIQKDAVTNILRKEQGLQPLPKKDRGLRNIAASSYRGLGISVTRSFIVNMVFFSVFEFSMAHIA